MGNDYSKLFATAKETGGGFGTCLKCHRNSATQADPQWCKTCLYVAKYDPALKTTQQVAQALQSIRSSNGFIRWPYATLDAVAGPIPLGQVVYVVAGTGIGKTTLSVDVVRRWITGEPMTDPTNVKQYVTRPTGVTVLPLETSPEDWRKALAANMVGINHGDVFEMVASFHEGDASMEPSILLVEAALKAQVSDPMLMKFLHVIEDETVTTENLGRAFAIAKAHGHKILVIDHIDQVGDDPDPLSGRKATGIEAVEKVNNAVLHYARAYQMVAVCMSQANMSVQGDGTNPLMRFRPLELKHVMYNSFKVKNAAQILGVYRPLRPDVTRDDFRLAREGAIDPMEVLDGSRMGLNALKLRHRGKNEQMKVQLVYTEGRVRDLTAQEMAETQIARSHGHNLTHMSFVPNDRSSDKPTAPKPPKVEPPPTYYEKEPPSLDM